MEFSNVEEDLEQADREQLMKSGRFALIYRLTPAQDGEWRLQEAFRQIRNDLWPWMARSELSWWTSGQNMEQFAELQFDGFTKMIHAASAEALLADTPDPTQKIVQPQSLPDEWTEEKFTQMKFVKIPGGCFDMGSLVSEKDRNADEGPVHEVCLDEFLMGRFEVTQQEWEIVMGKDNNP
ncbi:MAG: SUMF1/EgtB/PvdO family nonheme iron enzyme, partial [Chloroflexi bacterium]|nr:SUMF1/EgtB/PvdO family nonheme iron enzyme [Chloroflexota bacterium]